jgi:hypothetical protein
MGYYDQPSSVDLVVTFTCHNEECRHENENTDAEALDNVIWAICEKCGEQSDWDAPEYQGPCCSSDNCHC